LSSVFMIAEIIIKGQVKVIAV